MSVMRAAACLIALFLHAASAKDRPPPKRDEPVKATGCEYLGEGYIKAPGSDTCVKVSGYTRVEGAIFQR